MLVYTNAYDCVQVSRAAVEGYTGEGEPPCIVTTLSTDANRTVTLDGVQPPNTITITRPPDAANFQSEASTDDNDRFSSSNTDIGKLYMVMKTETMQLLHTECQAENDSATTFSLYLQKF